MADEAEVTIENTDGYLDATGPLKRGVLKRAAPLRAKPLAKPAQSRPVKLQSRGNSAAKAVQGRGGAGIRPPLKQKKLSAVKKAPVRPKPLARPKLAARPAIKKAAVRPSPKAIAPIKRAVPKMPINKVMPVKRAVAPTMPVAPAKPLHRIESARVAAPTRPVTQSAPPVAAPVPPVAVQKSLNPIFSDQKIVIPVKADYRDAAPVKYSAPVTKYPTPPTPSAVKPAPVKPFGLKIITDNDVTIESIENYNNADGGKSRTSTIVGLVLVSVIAYGAYKYFMDRRK